MVRPSFDFTGAARLYRTATGGLMGWAVFALAHHPASANRKHLPDKATRWFAAKVRSEFSVFFRPDKPPQWNLALQALLEPWIGLDVRRKVSRVVNKVLCDCIHLDIVGRNLHADRLHVGKLSAACGAIR